MNKDIADIIVGIVGADNVRFDEPMKKHTTFKIGGPADIMVYPHTSEEVKEVYTYCLNEKIPVMVIGNGSNLLVSDAGIRGVVIKLAENFADIMAYHEVITAEAGALLSRIGVIARDNALSGFEFASGIPGCVGGACVMNAGAYGGEMKDILISVTAMDKEGNIKEYYPEEMELGYRTSIFEKKKLVVLSAKLKLRVGNFADIDELMKDLAFRRKDKQPLEWPSAGSTFKRPEGYFAGKLLMDAGLAGYTVGGAQVSAKHCGFIINVGGATAKDVITLMNNVSDKIFELNGVRLEPEVRLVGEL